MRRLSTHMLLTDRHDQVEAAWRILVELYARLARGAKRSEIIDEGLRWDLGWSHEIWRRRLHALREQQRASYVTRGTAFYWFPIIEERVHGQ